MQLLDRQPRPKLRRSPPRRQTKRRSVVACAKEGLRLLAAVAPIDRLRRRQGGGEFPASSGAAFMRAPVPLLIEAAAAPSATHQQLGGDDGSGGTREAPPLASSSSLREMALRLVTSLPTSPAAGVFVCREVLDLISALVNFHLCSYTLKLLYSLRRLQCFLRGGLLSPH